MRGLLYTAQIVIVGRTDSLKRKYSTQNGAETLPRNEWRCVRPSLFPSSGNSVIIGARYIGKQDFCYT